MSLLDNFPHVCSIYKRVRSKGNSQTGGSVDPHELVVSGVSCWEQQLSSREFLEFQKREIVATRKIYFLSDQNLGTRNVIKITSRDGTAISSANQKPLDVVAVAGPDATAGQSVVYRAYCTDTTGDGI